MSDPQVRVTFQPQGRAVHVMAGTKIIEAAARAGLTLDTPCGGGGLCGKCRVQIAAGACGPSAHDVQMLSKRQIKDGWRLACQTALCGPSVIHIPDS